jgi:hypothetical protein
LILVLFASFVPFATPALSAAGAGLVVGAGVLVSRLVFGVVFGVVAGAGASRVVVPTPEELVVRPSEGEVVCAVVEWLGVTGVLD